MTQRQCLAITACSSENVLFCIPSKIVFLLVFIHQEIRFPDHLGRADVIFPPDRTDRNGVGIEFVSLFLQCLDFFPENRFLNALGQENELIAADPVNILFPEMLAENVRQIFDVFIARIMPQLVMFRFPSPVNLSVKLNFRSRRSIARFFCSFITTNARECKRE